jgi:hypothetical protein
MDGNGNGGNRILTPGNIIAVITVLLTVGGAYAAVSVATADNARANADLWKIVYDFKKDTNDFEAREILYDAEIRQRIDALQTKEEISIEKARDILNQLQIQLGGPKDGRRRDGP